VKRTCLYGAMGALLLLTSACDLNFGSSGQFIPAPAPDLSSPPARVARLSYLQGPVSFRPAGSEKWAPAVLNRPLTSGDELWTDAGGRAEVDLGSATIRLDARTYLGLLEFSDDAFQAKLTEGVIGIRVSRVERGDVFEIDTPNASATPTDTGEYRIEVKPSSNATEIVVRSGEVEVTNSKEAFEVPGGRQAHVNRTRLTDREVRPAPALDAFDHFCESRDREEERPESGKYVAAGVIGAYDLDAHGVWRTDPELGPYWTPRVEPGWAPYRHGRWAWIEPWGWTWIDDASWGFATTHCGRWAWMENGWAWIPGKPRAAPVFASALVVFVANSTGKDGVAWLPLGPREFYVPPYRASQRYMAELNAAIDHPSVLSETIFERQLYANRSAPGAVSAVSREAFTSGQPVGSCAIRVDARDAALVKALGASPAVTPRLESLSAPAPRGVRVAEPSAQNSERPVIVRRTPASSPVPFELTLPLLKAHPGKPLDRETLNQMTRPTEEERE
jgi:FecR protein